MNVTLDGKRMKLDSIVHYRESYSIALGHGTEMVYRDGSRDLLLGLQDA
jgi:Zn-dependent metalloprotease